MFELNSRRVYLASQMISESTEIITGEMKAPKEEHLTTNSNPNCSFIKTSLSMTALPPNDNCHDSSEVIKAKLRIERPYNSLKNKRNSRHDSWRRSWGSGQSHSSNSLYSNATGIGLNSGKDEFWAALQSNYNYIMDTNLLDACRQARFELEPETRTVVNTPESCSKMLQPSRAEGTPEDIKNLRRWLREKEEILAKAPTLFEATRMTTQQLQTLATDHSVLYYDIVSHARVVTACVRASEKETKAATLQHSKENRKTSTTNGEHRTSEDNLKGLERRYHLLYLKAIEIQCLFEGLLGKRNSSNILNRTSSTETDEEPASKVARYSDEPKDSAFFGILKEHFTTQAEAISDDIISEEDSVNSCSFQKKFSLRFLPSPHSRSRRHKYSDLNAIEFDADSESSEFEDGSLNKGKNRDIRRQEKCYAAKKDYNQLVVNETMDFGCSAAKKSSSLIFEATAENSTSLKIIQKTILEEIDQQKSVGVTKKRERTATDISKFNRSDRKSKNCAIFYFKHLDTDNENLGLSSQGSDVLKSDDPSSDDEGWFFSNDCTDGKYIIREDFDKENNTQIEKKSNSNSIGKLASPIILEESATKIGTTNDMEEKIVEEVINSSKLSSEDTIPNQENEGTYIGNLNEKSDEILKKNLANSPEGITNKESIKQLVIDAENLVRDELMKTPSKCHSIIKISSTVKKREQIMSGTNLQKVQEWLEYETQREDAASTSQPPTDCEASGENTESESNERDSDTSEGFTDSVATCMQTADSNSQCTSTEIIGGSAEPIPNCGSNTSLSYAKVIRRTSKRTSDRPWSVSCLSQLTESDKISSEKIRANQGLATHSISESALHILSAQNQRSRRNDSPQTPVKSSDSKGSLKRRKPRRRKTTSKKSDSGSDGLLHKLFEQQSVSCDIKIVEDITKALSMISVGKSVKNPGKSMQELESEEENILPKPDFKIGSITNTVVLAKETKLGSLAALANYMHDEQGGDNTGTEDHSSFSEQAWDNYQEKYNSENYSEGMDSDAARRLLEFGDDYRNFLDSQSDCCSSLSAANNFDSLSPPRMDSLNASESKLPQQPSISTVDHIRRRRALELEYERRRELKKKNSNDDEIRANRSSHGSGSSINNGSVKGVERTVKGSTEVVRRLDFGTNSLPQFSRRASETDTNSTRRRKSEDSSTIRRRISRTSDKALKIYSLGSLSSNASSDEEKEVKSLLTQSRSRLENTNSLKIRSLLLKPEDYDEITTTCRDNIACLSSVLYGAPGTGLSTARNNETKELLSSWQHLLMWSENTAVARKLQEEMVALKNTLQRFGHHPCDLDSEAAIQFSIEELKSEKIQLQTYRTNMLCLNASVHSWLTREEIKLKKSQEIDINSDEAMTTAGSGGALIGNGKVNAPSGVGVQAEEELHKQLKIDVSEMYCAWDEADARVSNYLQSLTNSLTAWRQLEFGLSEFRQVLDDDRGTLQGLEGALDRGQANPTILAQNVKVVAKLLSEKVANGGQQVAIITHENSESRSGVAAQFPMIITSSNGSLSDSGISDGGATSDGGLSERERRLGVLRRLAKQLENALAPGSEALRSIAARMESAELELKVLQKTCRELIVRTSVSQQTAESVVDSALQTNGLQKESMRTKKSPGSKRKNKLRSSSSSDRNAHNGSLHQPSGIFAKTSDSGDPDDPKDDPPEFLMAEDDFGQKQGWAWRVARIALPVQIAIITLLCAACFMEPHCCDTLNNFSMSFAPQLRYIRGPPPI